MTAEQNRQIGKLETVLTEMYLSNLPAQHITDAVRIQVGKNSKKLAQAIGGWVYGILPDVNLIDDTAERTTTTFSSSKINDIVGDVESALAEINITMEAILDGMAP